MEQMPLRLHVFGFKLLLILAFLAGAVASANQSRVVLLARLNPRAALNVDPYYAPAALLLGDVLLSIDPRGGGAERIRLARTALRRQPLAADAVRQIGMARDAGRIAPEVRPFMILSEKLSRRDALAQLWLAQDRFKVGDVAGGMAHIDTAIRVYQQAQDLIFPILVRISNSPRVAEALAVRSDAGADWVSGYLNYLLTKDQGVEVIARVLMNVRAPSELQNGSDLTKETVRKLAVAGKVKLARSLFTRASDIGLLGKRSSRTSIPWRVFDQPGAAAEARETTGGIVLDVLAERGANSTVAQQVRFDATRAAPQRPRVRSATISAGARIELRVRCGSSSESIVLWSAKGNSLMTAPSVKAFPSELPANCSTALYSIEIVGPEEGPALAASLFLPQGPAGK